MIQQNSFHLIKQSPDQLIEIQGWEINAQFQTDYVEEVCQICYKHYKKTKSQLLRPAMICYECWHQHVKTNLTKISYMVGSGIISPFEGATEIDVCIALNGLRINHRQQLEEWLFKKYATFTKDIEKCPSQTCDYVFTMEKCKWIVKQDNKCPKCEIALSVSQNITLKSVLGLIYFIFLANKCPKCEIPIQRISGCPHMTCPCGHQFCWFCLKDHLTKQNNIYTVHENKQCAFIFFSKILIFMTCLLSLSCFLVGGETIRQIMECIFNFLGYLVHSILIDLYVFAQWVLATNIGSFQLYRRFPFQTWSKPVKLIVWGVANLLFLVILVFFQLFYTTLAILVIQIGIVGIGALVIYSVIFSYLVLVHSVIALLKENRQNYQNRLRIKSSGSYMKNRIQEIQRRQNLRMKIALI